MSGHRYSLNEKITLCRAPDKCIWFELKTGELFPDSTIWISVKLHFRSNPTASSAANSALLSSLVTVKCQMVKKLL